jgi:hypothetical protein
VNGFASPAKYHEFLTTKYTKHTKKIESASITTTPL